VCRRADLDGFIQGFDERGRTRCLWRRVACAAVRKQAEEDARARSGGGENSLDTVLPDFGPVRKFPFSSIIGRGRVGVRVRKRYGLPLLRRLQASAGLWPVLALSGDPAFFRPWTGLAEGVSFMKNRAAWVRSVDRRERCRSSAIARRPQWVQSMRFGGVWPTGLCAVQQKVSCRGWPTALLQSTNQRCGVRGRMVGHCNRRDWTSLPVVGI